MAASSNRLTRAFRTLAPERLPRKPRRKAGVASDTPPAYGPEDVPTLTQSETETIAAAMAALARVFVRGAPLTDPATTKQMLSLRLATREHEVFGMLLLDNRHRVLAVLDLFTGTIDGASVHPREVMKTVLAHNAAAVILFHNHPSGVAEPSDADRLITRRLREALGLVEVRVLDHFVIGGPTAVSFAERGWL
jgi:DNA repair protein RadC